MPKEIKIKIRENLLVSLSTRTTKIKFIQQQI